MATIEEKIKQIRKEKGMTQKELAEKMGVTYTVISGYERGKRKPKIETIIRIANALNVSTFDIVPAFVPSDEMTLAQARQAVKDLRKKLEEYLEQQTCDDAISREDALQALCRAVHKNDDNIPCINQRVSCLWNKTKVQDYAEEILKLPSVTPQPKTGYWIEKDGYDGDTYYDCSECGESWATIEGTPWDNGMNYCPNCGAKMEVEE